MYMKKIFGILTALALLAAGCCKPAEVKPVVDNSSISLSEDCVTAGPEGGSYNINVTSSEDWRVSGRCDWATLTPSGKKGQALTVNVAPNDTGESREATFKVFTGSAVATLKIVSAPSIVMSLLTEDAVSVSSGANELTVTLHSNAPSFNFDFRGCDWISFKERSEFLGKAILKFQVARSKEFKARNGKIVITGDGASEPVTIDVTQAQRDTAFVVGEQNIIKDLDAYDIPLTLKSNVDVTYSLPSWLNEVSKEEGAMDEEEGLKTTRIVLHCGTALGSRQTTLAFRGERATYGTVFIKQQNPNPTFVTIPDEALRTELEGAGWILATPGSDQGELLEPGMTSTSLTIGKSGSSSSRSGFKNVRSLEGLEQFPALSDLTLSQLCLDRIDMDELPNVTSIHLMDMGDLTEVDFGSRQDLPTIRLEYTYRQRHWAGSITFTGEYVTTIDLEADNTSIYVDEEFIEWIDVTGCPKLETLKAIRRNRYGESPRFDTIYMTATQKASVNVSKLDKTAIVVK